MATRCAACGASRLDERAGRARVQDAGGNLITQLADGRLRLCRRDGRSVIRSSPRTRHRGPGASTYARARLTLTRRHARHESFPPIRESADMPHATLPERLCMYRTPDDDLPADFRAPRSLLRGIGPTVGHHRQRSACKRISVSTTPSLLVPRICEMSVRRRAVRT